MILNIYQLWQAEWGFTGIFCFTRIEVLISSSTVNYYEVKFLKNEIICVSHLYAKVVVFSKVPLPNYRFDLDDKRPQREVFSHNSVSLAVPFCMHFFMHHYTAINVHCRVQNVVYFVFFSCSMMFVQVQKGKVFFPSHYSPLILFRHTLLRVKFGKLC